jgi:hypothetical protein
MKNNIHIFGVIIVIFLIGIPITTHAMSARPPLVSEKIETNGYLEKSRIDNRKTFIYDKNGKVFGYAKKISSGFSKWTITDKISGLPIFKGRDQQWPCFFYKSRLQIYCYRSHVFIFNNIFFSFIRISKTYFPENIEFIIKIS